jgi:hypothetical protein
MSLSALASCKFLRLAQGQVSVTISSGDGIGTPCSYNGVSESKHLHDARSVDLQTTWKSGSDGLGYSPMRAALALVPATVGIVAGNAAGMPPGQAYTPSAITGLSCTLRPCHVPAQGCGPVASRQSVTYPNMPWPKHAISALLIRAACHGRDHHPTSLFRMPQAGSRPGQTAGA